MGGGLLEILVFLGGWIAGESVAIKSAQFDLQTSSWYRSTRLDLLFQAGYSLTIKSEVNAPKKAKTPKNFLRSREGGIFADF